MNTIAYFYFLLQHGASFYRVGIEGDRQAAQDYYSQYFNNVQYIDEYPLLFKGDIDKESGVGSQVHPGFITRTFHHVHTLMTRRTTGDFFKYLALVHKRAKENMVLQVKQAEERKEKRRKKL